MEESRIIEIIAKVTVRPARIPVFILLIFAVFVETESVPLTVAMVFMAVVFDMAFLLITEQFKILMMLKQSVEALGQLYEDHDTDLAEVERKAHVHT